MKFSLTSIKSKLIIISFMLVTIPLLLLGFLGYNSSKSHLDGLGATNLKNSVSMTIELIHALQIEVDKGFISLEEAQERVKVAVLGEKNIDGTRPINPNIDLGDNGYIFILDSTGTDIAHPTLERQYLWDVEDRNGIKFVQEMIHIGS